MRKRFDLMYQCLDALSRTLADAGLERAAISLVRHGLLEVEVAMEGLNAHEESARFVDTVVMHLRRAHGVSAEAVRLPDGQNAGSNVHPWKLVVSDGGASEELLPLGIRCRCRTSGKKVSTLHIVLG